METVYGALGDEWAPPSGGKRTIQFQMQWNWVSDCKIQEIKAIYSRPSITCPQWASAIKSNSISMYTIPYEYRVQPENLQILIKFMSFVIQTAEATLTNPATAAAAIIETLTNWNEKVLETRIVLINDNDYFNCRTYYNH